MKNGSHGGGSKAPEAKAATRKRMAARFRFHFVFHFLTCFILCLKKVSISRHARHGTRSAWHREYLPNFLRLCQLADVVSSDSSS